LPPIVTANRLGLPHLWDAGLRFEAVAKPPHFISSSSVLNREAAQRYYRPTDDRSRNVPPRGCPPMVNLRPPIDVDEVHYWLTRTGPDTPYVVTGERPRFAVHAKNLSSSTKHHNVTLTWLLYRVAGSTWSGQTITLDIPGGEETSRELKLEWHHLAGTAVYELRVLPVKSEADRLPTHGEIGPHPVVSYEVLDRGLEDERLKLRDEELAVQRALVSQEEGLTNETHAMANLQFWTLIAFVLSAGSTVVLTITDLVLAYKLWGLP
jgi:hypothetical protein